MNAVFALYRSTIGKKIAMAISGAAYVGFVLFHLMGNMTIHAGPEWINGYGHHLQELLPVVWGGRIGLLAMLVIHVASAISLMRTSAAARPTSYKGPKKNFATTSAAKSMRYGGIAILLFLFWHLSDFTVGLLGPVHSLIPNGYEHAGLGFIRGELYHNLLMSFGNPVSLVIYVVAITMLGFHLFHGVWSAVQTLGFRSATSDPMWRNLAAFIAVLVVIGNLSFPLRLAVGVWANVPALAVEAPHEVFTCHGQYYGPVPPAASAHCDSN